MARRDRLELHQWDGHTVLDLGAIEIWDGADMSLLRDSLAELIEDEGVRAIGVNLQYVKYIPSGFFGMLFDWYDRGVTVRLYRPQPNVAGMLWFRQFFHHLGEGCYRLMGEPQSTLVAVEPADDHRDREVESLKAELASVGVT